MAPGASSPNLLPYASRMQKVGAAFPEMRALLLAWEDRAACAEDLIARNVLGLSSRSRMQDVITEAFVPRFVRSRPPDLWRAMAVFERARVAREVNLALHFHLAAEAEPLLGEFATYVHADRDLHAPVTVEDVLRFIQRSAAARFPKGRWSPGVSKRVAQGVLSTLRDFGHLRGERKKLLTAPALPPMAFAWIAAHRRVCGVRSARVLRDVAWARFGLGERAVERLLFECHALGYLEYHSAGSVVRLEFPTESLEGLAHALVEGRAHAA